MGKTLLGIDPFVAGLCLQTICYLLLSFFCEKAARPVLALALGSLAVLIVVVLVGAAIGSHQASGLLLAWPFGAIIGSAIGRALRGREVLKGG